MNINIKKFIKIMLLAGISSNSICAMDNDDYYTDYFSISDSSQKNNQNDDLSSNDFFSRPVDCIKSSYHDYDTTPKESETKKTETVETKKNISNKNLSSEDLEKIDIPNTYLHQRVQKWMETRNSQGAFSIELLSIYAHVKMMSALAKGDSKDQLDYFMNSLFGNMQSAYKEILEDVFKNNSRKFPGLKDINFDLKIAAGQNFDQNAKRLYGMIYCDFINEKAQGDIKKNLDKVLGEKFFEENEDISGYKYAGASKLKCDWKWMSHFSVEPYTETKEHVFWSSRFKKEQYLKLNNGGELYREYYHIKEKENDPLSYITYWNCNYSQEKERYDDRMIAFPIGKDAYYVIQVHTFCSGDDPTPIATITPENLDILFTKGKKIENFDVYLSDRVYKGKSDLRGFFNDHPIISGEEDFSPGYYVSIFTQDLEDTTDKTGGKVISKVRSGLRARGGFMTPPKRENIWIFHAYTAATVLKTGKGYVPLTVGYDFGEDK